MFVRVSLFLISSNVLVVAPWILLFTSRTFVNVTVDEIFPYSVFVVTVLNELDKVTLELLTSLKNAFVVVAVNVPAL